MTRTFLGIATVMLVALIRGGEGAGRLLRDRLTASTSAERGDVPGWVMVTLMSAGLVAVIWILADDWLRQLFQQAVDRVSGP